MVKLLQYAVCFLLCCVLLHACGVIVLEDHAHEWRSATCTEPRTCRSCGETAGEPFGHNWKDATCLAPKTCQRCHITEGERGDHTWTPATCTTPQVCQLCGKTTGEPLGHAWEPSTLESPMTCTRCGLQDGDPLTLDLFNRGRYSKWKSPSASQYVGMTGYVAVTDDSFLYASTDTPYDNDWFSTPWKASTYEKDKQFWNVSGTVEHKTPVTVLSQELSRGTHGTYCYNGYLLVERLDNGEQFYISVTDFVMVPYWESSDINDTLNAGPCLAVYHQVSDYYPVNRSGQKADISDGATVRIFGSTFWGGINAETNSIDALTQDGNGRCFFNAADLTIIY